jgi:hypothetical protein
MTNHGKSHESLQANLEGADEENWHISPKMAAAFTLAATLLASHAANAGTTAEVATRLFTDGPKSVADGVLTPDSVETSLNKNGWPVLSVHEVNHDTPPKTILRTRARTIESGGVVASINEQGKVQVDVAKINDVLDEIDHYQKEVAKQPGAEVDVLSFYAAASDEWGDYKKDDNLGVEDPNNTELAQDRLDAVKQAFYDEAEARGMDVNAKEVEETAAQPLIGEQERSELTDLAKAAGFGSVTDAISAVAHGEVVEPKLGDMIERLFVSERTMRVLFVATAQEPFMDSMTTKGEEKPDYIWHIVPIVIPPIPRRRRRDDASEVPPEDYSSWISLWRRPKPDQAPLHPAYSPNTKADRKLESQVVGKERGKTGHAPRGKHYVRGAQKQNPSSNKNSRRG